MRDEIGVGMQPMLSPNVIRDLMSVSSCQQVMDEWTMIMVTGGSQ